MIKIKYRLSLSWKLKTAIFFYSNIKINRNWLNVVTGDELIIARAKDKFSYQATCRQILEYEHHRKSLFFIIFSLKIYTLFHSFELIVEALLSFWWGCLKKCILNAATAFSDAEIRWSLSLLFEYNLALSGWRASSFRRLVVLISWEKANRHQPLFSSSDWQHEQFFW